MPNNTRIIPYGKSSVNSLMSMLKLDFIDLYTSLLFRYTHTYPITLFPTGLSMMQQRKPNISRFRSWWQNTSKTLDAVIVTPLVALLRIMILRLRSWWQKIKQHPMRSTFVIIACVLGIVLLIGGYFFNWTWTGFGPYTPQTSGLQRGKTLYDWLQLAIIPAAIAFGVWSLNRLQQKRDQQLADERAKVEREAAEKRADTERDIALDNQQEAALVTAQVRWRLAKRCQTQ
jgi:hypothetical protein